MPDCLLVSFVQKTSTCVKLSVVCSLCWYFPDIVSYCLKNSGNQFLERNLWKCRILRRVTAPEESCYLTQKSAHHVGKRFLKEKLSLYSSFLSSWGKNALSTMTSARLIPVSPRRIFFANFKQNTYRMNNISLSSCCCSSLTSQSISPGRKFILTYFSQTKKFVSSRMGI